MCHLQGFLKREAAKERCKKEDVEAPAWCKAMDAPGIWVSCTMDKIGDSFEVRTVSLSQHLFSNSVLAIEATSNQSGSTCLGASWPMHSPAVNGTEGACRVQH